MEGLNRGLDRVEAALQGVDGPGGRVAAAVGRVAGGIGTVAGGIGTGIGRVGAGRSTGLSTGRPGLSTDAGANDPNDPNKPQVYRDARLSLVHPPVPIHPAEWSKQAEREAAAARARAELNAGIRLLHRSAGAICADARSSLGARPPPPEDWGPLATLALTLAELARGAKKGGGFPDATAWVQRRRLNDADGGTVSKTVSSSGIAGRLGAWEMRESAFLAPAISRAAHSGLTGAQSLMSSVFGGRPAGRTGRAGRGAARSSGTTATATTIWICKTTAAAAALTTTATRARRWRSPRGSSWTRPSAATASPRCPAGAEPPSCPRRRPSRRTWSDGRAPWIWGEGGGREAESVFGVF